ncbi:transcriptional regulator, IclR family [Natronoarchaeum philippinense]|uniref:Transcriptional regulator, IclR family n=1 Tax=Natronoarchaeum philippinense TaxID=558529 RepID=A0A285P0C7_NATPI|nr:IclR family transcriptional regulator [Natronoarchaeum philippinense]SNZ15185.1 transcriptional regulator, IclR family [Natronoarchaeum philippinense]
MTEEVPVKAAKTSFEIINTLRELQGAGVSELADKIDKPTSTIHDHLRTLENEEYLVKKDGEYYVGTRFLGVGEQARSRYKVYPIASEELDTLAEQTGEHTNLMIEEHGKGIFLYKARGPDAVQLDTHAGMRVHLQTTSLGKSILAFRPREEVESIIDRHGLPAVTEKTISDRGELFDELDQIRERRFAYDDEERVKGMRCVAAPITNEEGRAIAAISVSGPKSRMRGETFREEIPELLLRSANVIEVNLSHA